MKEKLNLAWNNVFVRGGLFVTGASFITHVLNYLFHFYTARSLGPSGISEVTTLFSYLAIVIAPMAIVNMVIVQRISSSENPVAYTLKADTHLRGITKRFVPVIVVSLLIIPVIPAITNLGMLSAIAFFPLLALSAYLGLYQSYMQGLKLFKHFALIGLVVVVIKFTGSIFSYYSDSGYFTVLCGLTVSLFAGIYLSRFSLNKLLNRKAAIDKQRNYNVLKYLFDKQLIITAVSTLAIILLNNVDIVFVKKYLSADESGYYNSWSIFSKIIFYVTGPLISMSYVYFSHGKDIVKQTKVIFYSLVAVAIFGVFSFIIYSSFSGFLVELLLGNEFRTITSFLGLAALSGVLYSSIIYINNYFLARKSRLAFVLPIILPIYIFSLLYFPNSLHDYIMINVYSVAFIALIYCGCLMFFLAKSNYKQVNKRSKQVPA